MKHVTFGTARKLEDAGFPQPEMEWGQYWYSVNGHEILITGTSGRHAHGVDESSHRYTALLPGALTFAPTATDILLHLPECTTLSHGIDARDKVRKFWAEKVNSDNDHYADENPAEAAAKAYFAKAAANPA